MRTLIETLKKNNSREPLLYGISDRLAFPCLDPRHYLALLFRTRAHILQWREKDLAPTQNREFVRLGVKLGRETGKLFLVNSSIDLACEEGADGVHLTSRQKVDDIGRARQMMGRSKFLVGKSVHGCEEAMQAIEDGVDYLLLGPIFAPLSKPSWLPPLGPEVLSQIVVRSGGVPVIALGGIQPSVLAELVSAGAVGVAGISWLHQEVDKLVGKP